MLRFAVVTDIHYGFDRGNKKGAHAPRLVDRFVRVANKNKVDFAVDLGDRVICQNPEQDLRYLKKLKEHFNNLAMPKYSVHGNHDLMYLTRHDNADTLGLPGASYSLDIKEHHLIFWNPAVRVNENKILAVTQDDLNWLKKDLAANNNPCIVFSHVPLDNTARDDPPQQQGKGWYFPSFYNQGQEIREILEDSSRVLLCMAGHRHRNRHREINGIHYITHQSLTQRYKKTGHPRGAFSITEIDPDEIRIKGY
ncbi:MAG TPA: metallophosphoesterase, partial [Micavibrio sp.]